MHIWFARSFARSSLICPFIPMMIERARTARRSERFQKTVIAGFGAKLRQNKGPVPLWARAISARCRRTRQKDLQYVLGAGLCGPIFVSWSFFEWVGLCGATFGGRFAQAAYPRRAPFGRGSGPCAVGISRNELWRWRWPPTGGAIAHKATAKEDAIRFPETNSAP
jgi:hypothetical protein